MVVCKMKITKLGCEAVVCSCGIWRPPFFFSDHFLLSWNPIPVVAIRIRWTLEEAVFEPV
jgi:hypothetical protein